MKKWIELLSVMTLMSGVIGAPISVVASEQSDQTKVDASKNAAALIIKQEERPSKATIAKYGQAYSEDFWQQYRQFEQQYWQAYQQGYRDYQETVKGWQVPDDKVAASGYQAGREDAILGINKLIERHDDQVHKIIENSGPQKQIAENNEVKIPNTPSVVPDEASNSLISKPESPKAEPSVGQNQSQKVTDNAPRAKNDETKQTELPPVVVGATGRAFIKKMAPLAQEVGREYDLYPSVMLAQAALESNWGHSELANRHHNLFGVKATANLPSVLMPTTECDSQGKAHIEKAKFRKYQSNKESLLDYANTLSDPMYNGTHRKYAHTWRQATAALNGKYATDPHYSAKLNAVIRGAHLDRYDQMQKQTKTSHHFAPFAVNQTAMKQAKEKTAKAHHDHTDLATLGILGGAGSFSLFGFFRHLFGA